MSGLAGMLMGIANDIGSPAQLSEGQRGLFNTLGASLAPMPAVNPDDPASLRAAAAEALRRGDAQQARIYAVMASERENSVREKNASQNALLDEGNAEIQAEAARKRGLLTNMQAGAAYERFLSPDLLQAVKRGDIAVPEAMKAQQTMNAAAMKEQGANQRLMFKEAGANARAQAGGANGQVLSPGSVLIGPDGKVIANNPKTVTSEPLSVHMEKRLGLANDNAVTASSKAARYYGLADSLKANSDQFASGYVSDALEWAKNATGERNLESSLRTEYNAARASEAIANLPPGAASDADVKLALSGFPPANAQAGELASFMRGMAKISEANAKFNDAKAQFISDNSSEKGFLKHWKGMQQEAAIAAIPPAAIEAVKKDKRLTPDFIKKYGVNPQDIK